MAKPVQDATASASKSGSKDSFGRSRRDYIDDLRQRPMAAAMRQNLSGAKYAEDAEAIAR